MYRSKRRIWTQIFPRKQEMDGPEIYIVEKFERHKPEYKNGWNILRI